jgi:putative transposase
MIRRGVGIPASGFCSLVGIPRRTYYRKHSPLASGEPTAMEPRAAPSVDAAARPLEEYLREHDGFGRRRLHALVAADGDVTSVSTVLRAMR